MTKTLRISTFALLGLTSARVLAADFPPSGQAEYDTHYVIEDKASIDSGVISILTGINRNVAGEGPFNDMSVECLSHSTVIAGKWMQYASCVETDKDGDKVFTTSADKNHYIVGGTGKYQGITGTVPYTFRELHQTASGRYAVVVNHKASWTVKP
jgi:hypothetical protein